MSIKYNTVALKRQGLTDEDIARFISEDEGRDYQSLIDSGLTPQDIITFANEQDYSAGDVISRSFAQGATSTYRGVKQLAGVEPTDEELRNESEFRQMTEQSPWLAYGSNIVGNILGDPTNLIPGSLLFKGAKGALGVAGRVGALGAATGAVEPRYTEEDPSRLTSALLGGAAAGVLGGGIAKLTGFGKTLPDEIKIGSDGTIDFPKSLTDSADTTITPSGPNTVQTAETVAAETGAVVELPKLPQWLEPTKQQTSFFKTPVLFETDLDKALYIVGKPKTKPEVKTKYLEWIKEALNVDDATALKLAKDSYAEVIDKGKFVQKEAGMLGKQAEDVPFQMSKTLDNFLNPVDKNLDDFSKMVYNYGKSIEEVNGKAKITQAMNEDYSFKKISEAYANQGIKATPSDIGFQVKGYQKMVDELKSIEGRAFKPKSFEEYVKNGMSHDEHFALFKNGAFDGCL